MILITGGLGYLGGRITKHLLKEGYQVRISSSRKNAELPKEISECEIVHANLHDSNSLRVATKGISTIIHLAAMNAQSCAKDTEQALMINGEGTLRLLEAAKDNKVSKFIYFSTAHVYGYPLLGDISESSILKPVHQYSITHRVAEDHVIEHSHNSSLSRSIIRLSNAVGSPISKDSDCWMLVVNDLAKQVVTDNKMYLQSSSAIKRDFIPISDVCTAVTFLLESIPNTNCEVYNVGSGCSMTLNDLTELIAKRAGIVLGKLPNIELLNNNNNTEEINDLYYSVEKINNLGCYFENDIIKEIDQLLLNCKRWYISNEV